MKKIVILLAVVMLVSTMVIPASAASSQNSDTYYGYTATWNLTRNTKSTSAWMTFGSAAYSLKLSGHVYMSSPSQSTDYYCSLYKVGTSRIEDGTSVSADSAYYYHNTYCAYYLENKEDNKFHSVGTISMA